MTKKEIFETILDVVSDISGIGRAEILEGTKRSEVVEARCIAAHYLIRYGVLPGDVVRFSNGIVKHRHCVTKSANMFQERCRQSFSFRCDATEIGNILETNLKRKENQEKTR
jgi:hypothetical protein